MHIRSDSQGGVPAGSGWARLACAAAAGAVVAAVLGYGLSAGFSAAGLALVAPAADSRLSPASFLARSGLNFHAIHHVRMVGRSLSGTDGTYVSILWPISAWAFLPAAALTLGGMVSARLSGQQETARTAAGLWLAIPYAVLLLAARLLFVVPSVSIRLPEIEIGGWSPAPESLAVQLSPAAGSTVFHGLVFAIIFASLGAAGGPRALWRGLAGRCAWPTWARGAAVSLIAGQGVFLILFLALFLWQLPRRADGDFVRDGITLLPAAAGLAHYFSHGVTIRGSAVSGPAGEGWRAHAGLLTGTEFNGERGPLPAAAYLAIVVPPAALVFGGYVSARTARERGGKRRMVVGLAGFYALLVTALVPFYTLAQRSSIEVGEMMARAAVTVGPSASQAFLLALAFALVFGLAGASLHRPHADT